MDAHGEGALVRGALVAPTGPVRDRGDGGEQDDGEDGRGDHHAEDDPGYHRSIIPYMAGKPIAGATKKHIF
jgi:hypothetical protein